MATQGRAGSMAGALLNILNSHAYSDYINYVSKNDGVTHKDFKDSMLSEYDMLDLSQCYNGNRINANMLYDIFGNYSQMTGDGVRLRLLQEVGGSVENFEQYECAAYICLHMKETSLEDWLKCQTH